MFSGNTPVMVAGDDASPDWAQSPATAGDALSTPVKTFVGPGITTSMTVQFKTFYTPTTSYQRYDIDFVRSSDGTDILGIFIQNSGTGSGSVTEATLYDTADDSGAQTITWPAGFIHDIKVTYDGTDVKMYIDGTLQFTWSHVLATPVSQIDKVFCQMHWNSGPGSSMQVKGLTLSAGVL